MSYLHSVKGKVYENCVILSPSGERMCYCDEKKVKWYIKRGLAKLIDEKTIQLNFEPKGKGDLHLSLAYQNNTFNNCVVCNCTENLTKHHVVPYQYRKHFPEAYKSHNHFDILPVCIPHHEIYEREADKLNKQLRHEMGINVNSNNTISTPEADRADVVRGLITALEMNWDQIPAARRDEMSRKIGDYFNIVDIDRDSLKDLHVEIKEKVPAISSAKVLIGNTDYEVERFIVRWRNHFVYTMQPKFMLVGWIEDMEKFFYGK